MVLAYLMFTAFLIDQVQEFACKHFKAALKTIKRLKYLWEKMRRYFFLCQIDSWEDFYTTIAGQWGAKLSDMIDLKTTLLEMLLIKLCPPDNRSVKPTQTYL